jgi:3-phenylpropionate/trans-cinnamate dioxygenase ferredoxin reductase subunit
MSDTAKYVVLGNGAAGTTAAEQLRRNDPEASIVVVAAEAHPLYSRVALPRFVRGQMSEQQVLMRSFADYEKQRIELWSGVTATAVDPECKTVQCDDGRTLGYDKLLIATGGKPRRSPWSLPGDHRTSMTFQTLEDAREIAALGQSEARVLVVGGGFIGYELAEGVAYRKTAKVTWLIRRSHFLADVFDDAAGEICRELAEEAGVDILTDDAIGGVEADPSGYRVITARGRRLEADVIAQGIGIDFYTEPARTAGLEINRGIRTNSRLQTRNEHIYAAGDVATFLDIRTGRYRQTGAWDSAVAQGHLAADNMTGADKPFEEVETYTTSLFGSTMAVIGNALARHPVDDTMVIRGANRNYRRFHFADGKLVGALMIGSPKGRKRIIELIRDRVPIRNGAEALPELAPG